MIKINVIVKNKSWDKHLNNPKKYLEKKVKKLNKKIALFKKTSFYITMLLSGEKDIRYLNKKFRKKNSSTDVLSFPFYEKKDLLNLINKKEKIYLGDIILNFEKIKKNLDKKNFINRFDELWVHSILHLYGYKHSKDKDYKKMNKLENNILSEINESFTNY
tara:strand:+ start:195 stop:677 length:483 start_codon:yes stop_codon:yes gene_type:complete